MKVKQICSFGYLAKQSKNFSIKSVNALLDFSFIFGHHAHFSIDTQHHGVNVLSTERRVIRRNELYVCSFIRTERNNVSLTLLGITVS